VETGSFWFQANDDILENLGSCMMCFDEEIETPHVP